MNSSLGPEIEAVRRARPGPSVGEHVKSTRRSPILRSADFRPEPRVSRGRPACCVPLIVLVVRMPTTQTTEINQLLTPERVRIGLPGTEKPEVIDALVDLLAGNEAIDNLEAVRTAIFEREKKMSTGVGKGLGLPHAKTAAVTETVAAFATTEEPVDFGAVDDVPVRLLLLLVGPEDQKSQHVKILGRISRLVSRDSLRERLVAAESPETVIRTLREGEAELRG